MNRQHEVVPHQSTHEQSLEEGKPDAKRSGENKYTKSGFTRYAKLVFCFLGLQVSYVLWGLVQEYLMTKEYAGGKFKSSSFCVFGNRILALLISLARNGIKLDNFNYFLDDHGENSVLFNVAR
jgi:hypothetical protein